MNANTLRNERADNRAPKYERSSPMYQTISYEDLILGDKIGSGGFADVHTAIWKGGKVAVKKLRVQRVHQKRKKQFEEEIQLLAKLNHPNIVQFYGACVEAPNMAIVMELMLEGSLYDCIHLSNYPFDRHAENQIICDALSALAYVHDQDIVHRDIKSKNILLFNKMTRCKLTDFGLALRDQTESEASRHHGFAGTIMYSPKEELEGEDLSFGQLKAADVYSLAITTVELLTCSIPYDGLRENQIRRKIIDGVLPNMDNIDEPRKALLKTALSMDASRRPSANQFLKKFYQIAITP